MCSSGSRGRLTRCRLLIGGVLMVRGMGLCRSQALKHYSSVVLARRLHRATIFSGTQAHARRVMGYSQVDIRAGIDLTGLVVSC